MDSLTPGFYLSALQFVWLIAVTAWVALRRPGEEAGKALADFKAAIATDLAAFRAQVSRQDQANATAMVEQRGDLALLKERLTHMPTHSDIRELVEGMADMRGKLGTLTDGQERQQHTLDLIQEYMNRER